MAQLAFGLGGAIIGGIFGGPLGASIGWAIGSAVGGLLFQPDGPTIEGPRLGDLTAPGGAEGTGIPIVRGTVRVPGRVIWSTDIVETRHEEEVEAEGGKGGPPSATQVTYTYSISFAVSLCEAPSGGITGVRRIWADSKLIYSVGDGADPATFTANTANGVIRCYSGSNVQLPDPLIAATVGESLAPAYRGTAYIVFDTLQLADFANHRPMIEAEVVVSGSPTSPTYSHTHPDSPTGDWKVVGVDLTRSKFLLSKSQYDAGAWIWRWDGGSSAPVEYAYLEDAAAAGGVTTVGHDPVNDQVCVFENNSPVAGGVTLKRFDGSTGAFIGSAVVVPTGIPPSGVSEDVRCSLEWVYDRVNGCFWSLGDGWGSGEPYLVSLFPSAGSSAIRTVQLLTMSPALSLGTSLGRATDNDGVVWLIVGNAIVKTGAVPEVHFMGGTSTYSAQKSFMWKARNEIWIARTTDLTLGWRVFDVATETFSDSVADVGFSWSDCTDYSIGHENAQGYAWFLGKTSGGGPYATLRDTNGVQVHSHNSTSIAGAFIRYVPGVCLTVQTDSTTKSFFEYSLAQNGVGLDALVEDLCDYVGLTSVTTTSLASDTVRGYVVSNPVPLRGAIEPLMGAFIFDAVEHDGTVAFVKRGGASAATFDEDDLGARPGDSGSEPPPLVTTTRALESELPAVAYLRFINQDLDYDVGVARARRLVSNAENVANIEFPIVFTSDEAHQVVDRIMRYAWLERERFEFAVGPKWRTLEPTDVVTLPDGRRVRITEIEYSPNGPVRCRGVSDDQGALTSYAVGNEGETGQGVTIEGAGPTVAVVLDIPLLVDGHNDEGLYLAACGEASGWPGGVIYYSRDNGATWQGAAPTYSAARIGSVISGQMRGRADHLWDNESRITVRLVQPDHTISTPASLETFYNGANAFAISSDGEAWEICQAYTVTANADGTYTLENFLRGRKGTEHNADAWEIGARLVFLEAGPIKRTTFPLAAIGTDSLWRAVGFRGSLLDAPIDDETFDAVSALPYAPVAIGGARQANGDFQLFATRRARRIHEWANSMDVPLDEPTEEYVLEIYDDGFSDLKRTVTGLAEMSYTYTTGMQSSDLGSPAEMLTRIGVRWYQVSSRVGRGIAGEALIPARDSFRFYAPDVASEFTFGGEQPYVQVSKSTATNKWAGTNFFANSGKWYWETLITGSPAATDVFFGISSLSPLSGGQNQAENRLWRGNQQYYYGGGAGRGDGNGPTDNIANGSVVGIAWDAFNGYVWISLDGDWNDNDPEGGTMYVFYHTPSIAWRPAFVTSSDNSSYTLQIRGAGQTQYPVPAGFAAIP